MAVYSEGGTVATTDTLVKSAANSRGYVGIQNLDAANDVHIAFGGQAATALNGIRIGPGEFYDILAEFNGVEIRGIAITAAVNIVIVADNR
jgi:hypothetical protein